MDDTIFTAIDSATTFDSAATIADTSVTAIDSMITVIDKAATAIEATAFFAVDKISAPICKGGVFCQNPQHVADGLHSFMNGWIVTGMGMFIAFSCLLIIMAVVKYLPYLLKILDYIIPEKVAQDAKKIQNANTDTTETIAAAIAVAYHNYNDPGR